MWKLAVCWRSADAVL